VTKADEKGEKAEAFQNLPRGVIKRDLESWKIEKKGLYRR